MSNSLFQSPVAEQGCIEVVHHTAQSLVGENDFRRDAHMSYSCSSPLFSTSTTSSSSVLCSSDQLRDVVSLALELLPPLPEPAQIVEENRRIIAGAQRSRHPSPIPFSAVSCMNASLLFKMLCHAVKMDQSHQRQLELLQTGSTL